MMSATGTPVDSGLQITLFGTDVSNVRLYPPGQLTTQLFHKDFLRMLKGASCIRCMDLLGTNGSNVVNFDDFKSGEEFSYYQPTYTITANVTTMQATTNNGFYVPGVIYILVTTDAPHGLTTGHTVEFTGCATLTLENSTTFSPNGFPFFIAQVLSDTTFGFSAEPNSISPVNGVQTVGGQVSCQVGAGSIPLADCVELANTLGTDIWVNVPHLMTDDGMASMAALVAANLASGKYCYVEYSNECWNFSTAFTQTRYCNGMGNIDPTIEGQTADDVTRGYYFYATQAGKAHAAFRTAFADASRDEAFVVAVYGGQMSGVNVAAVGMTEAANLGNPVDAVCIAPYYDNGPSEPSMGTIYDALSTDQLMDLAEYWMMHGPYVTQVAAQMAALPDGVQLLCYEGGPQSGVPLHNGGSITANDSNIAARSVAWGRHPRQALIYNYLMQQYSDVGVTLYNAFSIGGTCGTIDAGNPNSANWPCYFRWDMVPSPGDGSDGLFVNSDDFTDVTRVNSTIGYGVRRWQAFQTGNKSLLNVKLGNGKFSAVGISY
jgi:hypothetical protein